MLKVATKTFADQELRQVEEFLTEYGFFFVTRDCAPDVFRNSPIYGL